MIQEKDCIDVELLRIASDVVGFDVESASEDDQLETADAAIDLVMDVVDDLVDSDAIAEIPPEEAEESEKLDWIQRFGALISDEVRGVLESAPEGAEHGD